ncbi:uncharacterized protein TNCV_2514871 [Trichonephila clavipes]|nr:uncharacterized protein TNCV_2514871 [Trichonephila clavipes]
MISRLDICSHCTFLLVWKLIQNGLGISSGLALEYPLIPDLQARQCLSRIIFMQDGAPPHITCCVTDVLKHHFTEERVISRQFRHMWPPRSPDLNPCDFWLWGHLKQLVSCDQPNTLPDLKDSISRHVLST